MHNHVKKQLTKSPFNEQKDLLAQRYAVLPLTLYLVKFVFVNPTILLGPTYLPFQSYIHVPTTISPTNTR